MTGLQGPVGNSVAREVGRHLSDALCRGRASNSEMIPTSRILQSSRERPVNNKLAICYNSCDGTIHQVVVRDSSLF